MTIRQRPGRPEPVTLRASSAPGDGGNGAPPGTDPDTSQCPMCDGTGKIRSGALSCPNCQGKGEVPTNTLTGNNAAPGGAELRTGSLPHGVSMSLMPPADA